MRHGAGCHDIEHDALKPEHEGNRAMSPQQFQTPVVKLAKAIAGDLEQGLWRIPATAPAGLVAVEITENGVRQLLSVETTDFAELEALLIENLPLLEKLAASLEIGGWPDGHGVTPIFKAAAA